MVACVCSVSKGRARDNRSKGCQAKLSIVLGGLRMGCGLDVMEGLLSIGYFWEYFRVIRKVWKEFLLI